jgi:hypothetical protein
MPWLSGPIKRAREINGAWRAVGGVVSARAATLTARENDDPSVSRRGAHASIPKMGVFIPGITSLRGVTRFRY